MESSDSVKNNRWQEFGAKKTRNSRENWSLDILGGRGDKFAIEIAKQKEWRRGMSVVNVRERERERERAWSWEMGGRGRLPTFVPWLLVPNKSSSICIRKKGTKLLQKPSSYRWASWSCT
jgi:hypothetical protein